MSPKRCPNVHGFGSALVLERGNEEAAAQNPYPCTRRLPFQSCAKAGIPHLNETEAATTADEDAKADHPAHTIAPPLARPSTSSYALEVESIIKGTSQSTTLNGMANLNPEAGRAAAIL